MTKRKRGRRVLITHPALRRKGLHYCEDNLGEGQVLDLSGSLFFTFFRQEILDRFTAPAEPGLEQVDEKSGRSRDV